MSAQVEAASLFVDIFRIVRAEDAEDERQTQQDESDDREVAARMGNRPEDARAATRMEAEGSVSPPPKRPASRAAVSVMRFRT